MEVAFATAFISISTPYKVHGRNFAAMGQHYEYYLCLRIFVFAHLDLSLWLKDLQQGSATFNVACSLKSNNDSVPFLLRRANDFFRTDHL